LVDATAFLDLDAGSLVEVGVEAGVFFDGSLVKGAVEETSFWDLDGDGSLVEVGSGRKLVEGGGFFDDSLVEATAFLDLDGGSLVEVGVEAGEFFDGSLVKGDVEETSFWDLDGDGSLVEVGSGRRLVEVGGFFDDSLV
jgi:hypothetical protein